MVNKNLNNEKGLTLVEVLAVTVIGAIVMVLIFSVQLFGQKQYKHQTEKTGQLYDVTYAAKIVTKEIRESEKVKVNTNMHKEFLSLTLTKESGSTTTLELKNNSLLNNGSPLVKGISKFEIAYKNNMLVINLESIDKNGEKEKIETELYVRKGVSIE